MPFRLRIAPLAQGHIDAFAAYLRDYDEALAIQQIDRLNRILAIHIGESPLTWGYFALTGAPYRAYLFASGAVLSTGSSTPSTRTRRSSTSCISGTPAAIRRAWTSSASNDR